MFCPFGAIGFDIVSKRVIKCDLCDGDPECAKVCFYGAIEYVDVRDIGAVKQNEYREKFSGVMSKTA
jgi:Fe-S-cluster-containing hydrogenase component 2